MPDLEYELQDWQLAEHVGKELAWFLGLVPSKQGIETRDGPMDPAGLARAVVHLILKEIPHA